MPKREITIQTLSAISDGLAVLARSLTARADHIESAGREELLEAKAHLSSAIGLIGRARHKTGEP